MVDKKVAWLTGALVAGAALVLVMDFSRRPKADPRLNQTLFDATKAAAVDAIEVKRGESTVVLRRGADQRWRLGGDNGFPVDAAKVIRLIDDLGKSQYQQLAGVGKEMFAEFGLDAPLSLALKAGGAEALALLIGNSRQGGGQYVINGTEDRVYVVTGAISPGTDADAWEMKTLLNIPRDQVKMVSHEPAAAPGKKPVVLMREKKEDPLKVQAAGATDKEPPAVDGADSVLTGISFIKHYDPTNEEAKTALATASRVQVELFDGRRYELFVGSVGEQTKKYFLRIGARLPESGADAAAKDAVETLNQLMTAYAFEVPASIGQRLEKGW